MDVRIMAATSPFKFKLQEEFNRFSGEMAGICYMPNTIDDIINQPIEKKLKRAENTKANRHHSVFEHEYVTLYIENVPKLFAMLFNNEKIYTTSEKSGRYTHMANEGIEKTLYDKWQKILTEKITNKYGNEPYFTPKRIEKLAMENARYFMSIYTPSTSFAYTTSYRQLNYLYGWLRQIPNSNSKLLKGLEPYTEKFCNTINILGLIDEDLVKGGEGRNFSLETKKENNEYFGDVYCTKYKGSFVSLAQAQRHRTLNYQMKMLDEREFYVPPIIENDEELKKEWLLDMEKVADLVPQGQLIEIIEKGTPENFILKAKERLCTCAQKEIRDQTFNTLKKYIEQTKDDEIKAELEPYTKGARCTSGFKCTQPCRFKDGISLESEI